MAYDLNQVTTAYDALTAKVKSDLDEQFNLGRLKGSDYANVYSQLMSECLRLSFSAPINDTQVELYKRQTKGFDDNIKIKLFDSQMSSWGMMFSSGMLTDKPSIVTNDEVSSLYSNLKSELGM